MWISAHPLVVIDDFLKVPHLMWAWDFFGHVPNSPRNKNLKRLILNLLKKVDFLDSKRLLFPFGKGKKNFFFNFECYDLANGKEWHYKIW
jgi:hypothetical protein